MFSPGENSLPQWTHNLVMSNFDLHPSWTNTPWMETLPFWNNYLINLSVYASNHYDSAHTGTTQPFRTVTNTIYILKTRQMSNRTTPVFRGNPKLFVVILWYYIYIYSRLFTYTDPHIYIMPNQIFQRWLSPHLPSVFSTTCKVPTNLIWCMPTRRYRYPHIQPYQQLTNHEPWIFTFGV